LTIFGNIVLEFECSLLSLAVDGDDANFCEVPAGVASGSVCTFEFSRNSVHSIASYFLSLKMDVDASFGAYGASFSASTDYNLVLKNTAAQKS